jgi:hypothetical protein
VARRFEFSNPQEEEVFSKGVEAFTAGQAQALAGAHDFSPYRSVLDLGGGTGSFLVPVLGRYAHLTETVFEIPPVAAVARRVLAGILSADESGRGRRLSDHGHSARA